MRLNHRFVVRRKFQFRPQRSRHYIRHTRIKLLQPPINRPPNRPRAKRPNRLINRHDPPDFRRIQSFAADQFHLRIHHLNPSWPLLIHFRFAVQNQLLPGLQPPFQIPAMKKLARQRPRFVLHQQVINRIPPAQGPNRLPARHGHTQRKHRVRPHILDLRKPGPVLIPKRQISKQILQRVNPALCEQFRALRAHAFDHLHG